MIINDTVTIPSIIFSLSEDSRERFIIEYIKLNEFNKYSTSLILYSLEYLIHKHSTFWIAVYSYSTTKEEGCKIALRVPAYTNIFVNFENEETLVAKPPDGIRKLIQKKTRHQRRKDDQKQTPSVFTAYSEV
ncbi:hypothetical protein QKT26_gp07 [Carcinus maenas nudivirus]|uniref:Uncharacterized protein n=1 Tax=Carcinus maenas nudivirus TaxID=2880837 RepID=A0AAE9BZU3_9VIRU|nr:hypothetical protein QKT26_gp07 [Carcinus maenas nudivirus]UBZ25597.1 hypothetical protein CmNV_007 [Carcinus maenas nudivirus]